MAKVSGIDIYKHLPRTNCGDCGVPTCMAFAMQVASKKKPLDACAHVSQEARTLLGDARTPPMATISLGAGENTVIVGGETVLYRHEERFQHPPILAVRVAASLSQEAMQERIAAVKTLQFERVGKTVGVDAVAVAHGGLTAVDYTAFVRQIAEQTDRLLLLLCTDPAVMGAAAAVVAHRKPLLVGATEDNIEAMGSVASRHGLPLVVSAPGIERTAALAERGSAAGIKELLLDPQPDNLAAAVGTLSRLRRLAIEERVGTLGYPSFVDVGKIVDHGVPTDAPGEGEEQASEQMVAAISAVIRYAGAVVVDTVEPWAIHPIVTVRQDLYTDPQVPNAVEAKLYEIGNPGPDAPVLVTTNFALTYFTVAGEVEASKIPAFISVIDTEGLGVLNAYADDRLTAERLVQAVREQGVMDRARHNCLIIPGLVARMRIGIEEISGWDVMVGPDDAGGIPRFLHELRSPTESAG